MFRVAQKARVVGRWTVAVVAVAITTIAAFGYPKPASVPYLWQLNFEAGDLRLYVDEDTKSRYWYFTYTVTNRTGKDQLWVPNMVLYTDGGEILQAGRDVPSQITEDILDLLGNELLEDQNEVIGDILQGKEHAKEGLVIWPARNTKVTEMSLFVAGISGETARVKNPATGKEVILRKTLQRDYLVPGDAVARGSTPAEFVEETWILR
jgi:hypothetical protein